MHVNNRPKIMSLALKTLTGAVASAVLFSSAAYAAGLGKLTVLSSLGQPLRAEIELTAVSSEEAAGLVAKLAPPDAFRLANIEFNPSLLSLRFVVEQRNGRQYIKVTSSQPINEPFVDMLLELSWNSGRLVREYTFLLDPAELRATQSAQVTGAAPVDVLSQGTRAAAQAQAQASQKPRADKAPPAPPPADKPAPGAASAASEYKVKPGDTLGRIAAQVKPVDVSLDMMLVALYRANPDAFIGNNMNRLKSGQILAVPDSDSIKGSGEGEAHGVVVAHAADFNAYRNKLAGQVAAAAPAPAPEPAQSAAGKISAKVQERPTAANEAKDQLKLSKATAGAAGKTAGAEDQIVKDRALADATARVKELEKNVNDLEKLMVVKGKTAAAPAKPAEPVPASVPAVAPAVKPAPPAPAPLASAPAPAKPAVKKAAPPAPPEPTLVEMLMDNITYVLGGAGVLALALFGISRRKKKDLVAPTEPSILGAPTDQAHSLFAETGGQSVDTSNSVFNSSFAPSASQLDTNEVDPVAEADVYIAYGRDAQAEEILKEALRTHPERYPVRLKLLEIYAARKDQRAFEAQASEMYGMTKGQGDEWAQAAALGLSIDPLNPLYASATGAAPVSAAPTAEELGQQALLSQQLDDTLNSDAAMDLDLNTAAEAPTAAPEPAAAKTEDHTLDFDLGGLSFEPISQGEPIAMPGPAAAEPTADSVPDMEFSTEPPAAAVPEKTAQEESFDLAFDMAFDAPAAPAAPVEEKSLDDISLDLAGGDLQAADLSAEFDMADLAKDFDLPSIAQAPAAAPAADPLSGPDAMSFDLPAAPAPADDPFALPDLPGAAPAETASAHSARELDMSSIDLDLPPLDNPAAAAEPEEFAMSIPEPAENSAAHMEMETKLDLAIAYQEIGDKEGARELLDEVIKGGSSGQISKANELRARLA